MSANGIAHLATRELRQKAKLDLAATNRVARAGHRDNPVNADTRSTYDLTELPTQYNNNSIIDNDNGPALLQGRPWVNASAFTFYESFGTTSALATTQYVSGNKIYAYSSTFDVVGYQPAVITVNDIQIVNTSLRGHTLAILDTYGDTVSITTYDTYGTAGTLTTLASALSGAASGCIAVLVTYDATALNAAVRSAINTGYGSTNSNTWTANRVDQIFIGEKL